MSRATSSASRFSKPSSRWFENGRDDEWIYGHEPQNIYDTIVSGRPNGMPSFGGHISNDHVWKLVAYVRSLGQLTGKSASPGRSDNLYPGESEMKREGKEEPGRAPAEHPG